MWAKFKRTVATTIFIVIVLVLSAEVVWLLGPFDDHPTNWLDPVLHPDAQQ
jgi:hypothetical protein